MVDTSLVPSSLVGEVAVAVREAVLSWCVVNSCIESSRLGLLVFDRLGISARPQPVKVAVQNALSWKLRSSGVPFDQWPDEAYNLAVGFVSTFDNPDGWNGHLVVIVREPGKPRYLIDISADQFNRPGHLNVPGPVGVLLTQSLWTPVDPAYRLLADQSTIIEYHPYAPGDPVGQEYKTTPAWLNDPAEFSELADIIAKDFL